MFPRASTPHRFLTCSAVGALWWVGKLRRWQGLVHATLVPAAERFASRGAREGGGGGETGASNTTGCSFVSAFVRKRFGPFPYLHQKFPRSQGLATEPLRNSSITIKQVTAKKSRLVIEGEMAYDSAKVPFTYRTSIGVKGQVRLFFCRM